MKKIGMINSDRIASPRRAFSPMFGLLAEMSYNSTKGRIEIWQRPDTIREWTLMEAWPARMWKDRFMSTAVIVAAVLGFNTELSWTFNGRSNGAVAPGAGCFTAANEVGGGISINAIAGGQDNDYTAFHWGDNYPVMIDKSPHYKITISPEQITQMAVMSGLVDNTRSAGTAAFGYPDNGIWIMFDTDNADSDIHFIVRNNGIDVIDETITTPVGSAHVSGAVIINDACTHVKATFGGVEYVSWTDISGYAQLNAAQLQPYSVIVNRAAAQLREMHLHDFRLIMDRGY